MVQIIEKFLNWLCGEEESREVECEQCGKDWNEHQCEAKRPGTFEVKEKDGKTWLG